jgi:hypothetical protein
MHNIHHTSYILVWLDTYTYMRASTEQYTRAWVHTWVRCFFKISHVFFQFYLLKTIEQKKSVDITFYIMFISVYGVVNDQEDHYLIREPINNTKKIGNISFRETLTVDVFHLRKYCYWRNMHVRVPFSYSSTPFAGTQPFSTTSCFVPRHD